MKTTLAILALVVFAVSILADYKWRQWIQRRRSEHTTDSDPTHTPHP